jgi:hypothetical protein
MLFVIFSIVCVVSLTQCSSKPEGSSSSVVSGQVETTITEEPYQRKGDSQSPQGGGSYTPDKDPQDRVYYPTAEERARTTYPMNPCLENFENPILGQDGQCYYACRVHENGEEYCLKRDEMASDLDPKKKIPLCDFGFLINEKCIRDITVEFNVWAVPSVEYRWEKIFKLSAGEHLIALYDSTQQLIDTHKNIKFDESINEDGSSIVRTLYYDYPSYFPVSSIGYGSGYKASSFPASGNILTFTNTHFVYAQDDNKHLASKNTPNTVRFKHERRYELGDDSNKFLDLSFVSFQDTAQDFREKCEKNGFKAEENFISNTLSCEGLHIRCGPLKKKCVLSRIEFFPFSSHKSWELKKWEEELEARYLQEEKIKKIRKQIRTEDESYKY